jgi:hypothetical protein
LQSEVENKTHKMVLNSWDHPLEFWLMGLLLLIKGSSDKINVWLYIASLQIVWFFVAIFDDQEACMGERKMIRED